MNTFELILYISIIVIAVAYYMFQYQNFTYKTSRVDGMEYMVKNNHLAQESADALGEINTRLVKLIDHVKTRRTPPGYLGRLSKYNPYSLNENIWNIDTTYTVNKGQNMTFCLSPRHPETRVYEINILMYVAIHELAHVSSISVGHTPEFLLNFKSLLGYAIEAGLYEYIDYQKSPVEYCGLNITDSVL